MSAGKFYWSEDKSDQATWVLSCQYASSEVLWGAPTISVTVRNWWSNVHTHFTPWLASGAEVKKKKNLSLWIPFFIVDTIISQLFMWTTECNTKTVFQERLSGHMHCYLNNIMSPTSLWWPTFTPLLSVAVWNTFDPMLYKLVLIEHNLTLIVIIHCILLLYSIMLTSSFRASSSNLIKLSKKLFASESDWT